MAMVVTNLANLRPGHGNDAGADPARRHLNEETVLTSFWFTVGIGLVLGIAVAVLSPLAALAFEAPGVTGILWLLAVTFPDARARRRCTRRCSNAIRDFRCSPASRRVRRVGVGRRRRPRPTWERVRTASRLSSLTSAVVSSGQLWLAVTVQAAMALEPARVPRRSGSSATTWWASTSSTTFHSTRTA